MEPDAQMPDGGEGVALIWVGRREFVFQDSKLFFVNFVGEVEKEFLVLLSEAGDNLIGRVFFAERSADNFFNSLKIKPDTGQPEIDVVLPFFPQSVLGPVDLKVNPVKVSPVIQGPENGLAPARLKGPEGFGILTQGLERLDLKLLPDPFGFLTPKLGFD